MQQGPPSRHALDDFWAHHFPLVADTIVYRLGTCNGVFSMEQREYATEVRGCAPWRNAVDRLVEHVMKRILNRGTGTLHFGAIFPAHHHYAVDPRDHDRALFRSGQASAMGEFVLDVDLDHNYDRTGVCECGVAKRVCNVCWEVFMRPAQLITLRVLREVLEFRAVFCVFSGRRGFHTWVLDRRAVTATASERAAWLVVLQQAWRNVPWIVDDYLLPMYRANVVLAARGPATREAAVAALYPKYDEGVTRNASHPHKAPLVPHLQTGMLCAVMPDPLETQGRLWFKPQSSFMALRIDQSSDEGVTQLRDLMLRSQKLILRELNKL